MGEGFTPSNSIPSPLMGEGQDEGGLIVDSLLYVVNHTIQIFHYLIIPEPYYLETLALQPGSTCLVC